MRVSDVMTKQVQTIGPDAPIVEAACLMRDCDIGVLPVCDGDRITGMVTDRDITIRAVADGKGDDAKVREVMSESVICVKEEDDLEAAAQIMRDKQIKRVPVLDASGRLCGILSLGDLAQTDSDLAEVANEGITEGAGMDDGRSPSRGSRQPDKRRGGMSQSMDSGRARAQARGTQERTAGRRPSRGGSRNQ